MAETKDIDKQHTVSAVDKIINDLRERIVLKKLQEHSVISENQLSKEYNASRGSAREALRKLESEGLVELLPNGRRRVTGISQKFIRDLYDTRTMLEQQAGKILITNGEKFNYEPIAKALGKFYSLQFSEPENINCDRAIINTAFHRSIIEASDNKPLLQCWEIIEPSIHAIAKFNYIALDDRSDNNMLIQTHSTLLDKIVNKDPSLLDEIYSHILKAINESMDSYYDLVKSHK